MAIITDATGRQLAQAVGGIDTSGLVKDSTLQATNTELANIDTTGQSIASAISGLGQTLGSDRALIDGSNIADKATFRNNIGLEIKSKDVTGTTNAYGFINLSLAWDTNEIVAARESTSASTGRFCLLGVVGNNYCVRVINDASTYSPTANTAVTINVRYREV